MTIFISSVQQSVIFFLFSICESESGTTVCKVLIDVYLLVGVSVVVILQ